MAAFFSLFQLLQLLFYLIHSVTALPRYNDPRQDGSGADDSHRANYSQNGFLTGNLASHFVPAEVEKDIIRPELVAEIVSGMSGALQKRQWTLRSPWEGDNPYDRDDSDVDTIDSHRHRHHHHRFYKIGKHIIKHVAKYIAKQPWFAPAAAFAIVGAVGGTLAGTVEHHEHKYDDEDTLSPEELANV